MIDIELIESILNDCPVTDFSANSQNVIENEELADYINLRTGQLIDAIDRNLSETIVQKHQFEIYSTAKQPVLALCIMLINFVMGIHNYIVIEDVLVNDLNICGSNLMRNIITNFHGYISMIMSGIPEASYAQLRTMYESYIIFRFIQENPELAKPYIDHSVINRVHILRSFSQAKPSDDTNKEYEAIVKKYSKVIKENYGWSAVVIEDKKNRNLAGMVRVLGLEAYKPYYVMTSEMIHASSFSVFNQFDSSEYVPDFSVAAIEILTNSIIHFMKIVGIDENKRLLLMNIIYAIKEDLLDEPQGINMD